MVPWEYRCRNSCADRVGPKVVPACKDRPGHPARIIRYRPNAISQPIYNPARRHNSSTRPFTSSDMRITPGHGLVNPSAGHLRVASTPIFDP
jgi:hypothetical protein